MSHSQILYQTQLARYERSNQTNGLQLASGMDVLVNDLPHLWTSCGECYFPTYYRLLLRWAGFSQVSRDISVIIIVSSCTLLYTHDAPVGDYHVRLMLYPSEGPHELSHCSLRACIQPKSKIYALKKLKEWPPVKSGGTEGILYANYFSH